MKLRATLLNSPGAFAAIWPALETLRAVCGVEDDVLLHPLHYLAATGERRRCCSVACWDQDRLAGVLFAIEHWVWGLPSGYAIGGDCSGRGLLLCAPADEAEVIRVSVACLFAHRIHSLHLRIAPSTPERAGFPGLAAKYLEAVIPGDRMALGATFDAFLATLGKHTRRNVRYYMRRAAQHGLVFVPQLSVEEFAEARQRLNSVSSFPVKRSHMEEDDRVLALHADGERMGLRDREGVPVALLCGFSRGRRFHVLTQWNDARLDKLSLSIVLRGHLVEHLIASGHQEIQFMGGLSLSFGRFCTPRAYCSLSLDRPQGFMAFFKRRIAAYCSQQARAGKTLSSTVKTLAGGFLEDELLGQRIRLEPDAPSASAESVAEAEPSSARA